MSAPTATTAREVALQVCRDVFGPNPRGAREALDYRLRKTDLAPRDRAFATELAYGAIKMRRFLDFELKPFNLSLADPVRASGRVDKTVIYDYSNGQYPGTAQFLSQFLGGADVVVATLATPAPIKVKTLNTSGFVIFLGHDYGIRWYNLAS